MTKVTSLVLKRMRRPLIVLLASYAICMLGLVLVPGVDADGKTWHMTFFQAFYFVSYTATTIGFGELPQALSDTQRLWVLVTIYMTVVAWFYAIGKILSLVQDPAFRKASTANRFSRSVKGITEPFYVVLGYGDTGRAMVRAMTERHIRAVVIDNDESKVNAMMLKDYHMSVPILCADATVPVNLVAAGLQHPKCRGMIALTPMNAVNLKIAITSKLLNPGIPVICRADSEDVERNMASFGTDYIIDPYTNFSEMVGMSLHSPSLYLLYDWLTGVPDTPLSDPPYPPRGMWVLCGFGRFGRAVYKHLKKAGIRVVIVEVNHDRIVGCEDPCVLGEGTEKHTLIQANLKEAVGIVAGTDDDSNNLSIIMTAKQLNPGLFIIARQNKRANQVIFDAVKADLVMQPGETIARKIRMLLTIPLLTEFFGYSCQEDNDWTNILISRICAVVGDIVPSLWHVDITEEKANSVHEAISFGRDVTIEDLMRDPRARELVMDCIPLFLSRQSGDVVLPGENTSLMVGDKLLFCGLSDIADHMAMTIYDISLLNYIMTGEQSTDCFLLCWLKWKLWGIEKRGATRAEYVEK